MSHLHAKDVVYIKYVNMIYGEVYLPMMLIVDLSWSSTHCFQFHAFAYTVQCPSCCACTCRRVTTITLRAQNLTLSSLK